ncbi:MAG: creatininase family protein [Methanomassiliicoccales archaeon]|nr:creatininase family protein [Methanomassiliicoccales archaeon]
MRVEELTSAEFAKFMRKSPVAFVPFGATEAHGPHLPLGTDSLQPEALCDALADRLDGLVFPPVRYGHHSSTRNMPGTMALSYDTLRSLTKDILESLERNGVSRAVIVSGHAGSLHLAALRDAAEDFVRRSPMRLMVLTDYDIAYRYPLPEEKDWPDGHGGIVETSRILAIRPDLVKDKRPRGLFQDKRFMIVANPETCMPEGMVGDATKASAELGGKVNAFILDRLAELVERNLME